MSNAARWTREFSAACSFADDLGALGAWVGPRTGPTQRTQGEKEDYVLRRILVALRRQGQLNFPFTVHALERPDFVIAEASGSWGLEVTEAGSEWHQEKMTHRESSPPSADDPMPFDDATNEIRRAIERKNAKYDNGGYQNPEIKYCDLAVYNNINSYATDHNAIAHVNDPSLRGRFHRVFFVRDRSVYTDVLCNLGNQPDFVDITSDYSIDFAEWVRDQTELLRTGDMTRLDVEQLIEELSDLAKRQRRALRRYLQNLLLHLLKWQFQRTRRSRSWQTSINDARNEIDDLLMESPSLRDELHDIGGIYQRARRKASVETGLSIETFPQECPFSLESEVLSEDWLPGKSENS